MFWKKKSKTGPAPKSRKQKAIRSYKKEGGHIKSLERQGGLTTSASFGGMGVRELQLRMELIVDQVISSQRSVFKPAERLAEYSKVDQDRFLESVEQISRTSVELAFSFCQFAPESLQVIDETHWNDWIGRILHAHQDKGMNGAVRTMQDVDSFVRSFTQSPGSVRLEKVSRILESFVTGLSGRKLEIQSGETFYTDTQVIRLPEVLAEFDNYDDNFALYKSMVVHQWAQSWFGTWKLNIGDYLKFYKDPVRALALFHKLETIRLDACIERELPGVARAMSRFSAKQDHTTLSSAWQRAFKTLRRAEMTVLDTVFFLEAVYKDENTPDDKIYQGSLNPSEAWSVRQARILREKTKLQMRLQELRREFGADDPGSAENDEEQGLAAGFSIQEIPDDSMPDGFNVELKFDNEPIGASEETQKLLESILQDLGEVPDEYLQTDMSGSSHEDDSPNERPPEEQPAAKADTGWLYDEWDHSRQKYRKEWCHLRELAVQPVYDDFVDRTLNKHRSLLKHLHRTFEALREDDRRVKRQPYGDEVDLDAVIEAYSDTRIGLEASQNLFIRSRKTDRNIAVMFMIDMSASTSGWINEMEREALILLCESLEILGDRYAIFGFSGLTHERCELYKIKDFEEQYGDLVKARISGIQPQDYTRMGAAIRHLTKLLHQVEARTKLLIALSDGRPDDQDGYRGPYGIEDTRRALIEAKFLGIHPFCITIDEEAMDYLQHMYGPVSFAVIDHVDKLPYKVSDIYRRITV